ncbi:MAG: uracil-DNA glycosylase [Candidatus Kariarchaeaceae archaeon]|jgi:hypothetical protein
MNLDYFIDELAAVDLSNLFNPYADICQHHDKSNANLIRRSNLLEYLSVLHDLQPDTIWVGEALGYRGGRRTGLPFTDESHFSSMKKVYRVNPIKATNKGILKEITAKAIWEILALIEPPPILWNILPFHPHQSDQELSNRIPTLGELTKTSQFTLDLLDFFQIKKVIAIGRKAVYQLEKMGIPCKYVRHPSHGGINRFKQQIQILFL